MEAIKRTKGLVKEIQWIPKLLLPGSMYQAGKRK